MIVWWYQMEKVEICFLAFMLVVSKNIVSGEGISLKSFIIEYIDTLEKYESVRIFMVWVYNVNTYDILIFMSADIRNPS